MKVHPSNISSLKFKVSGLRFSARRAASATLNLKLETLDLRRQGPALSVLLALLFAPAMAVAQVLNDPTRPATGGAAVSDAFGEPGAAATALLQSVMITPTERSAIIGGERVKLGGKFGEARVVKITESEVVLHSVNGSEILRMYPNVSMKTVEPEQPAGKKPAAKSRRPAAATREKQK
jgi:MSHA biogenesis protein MshK